MTSMPSFLLLSIASLVACTDKSGDSGAAGEVEEGGDGGGSDGGGSDGGSTDGGGSDGGSGDGGSADCDDADVGTWYLDADGDGFGQDASMLEGCRPSDQWSAEAGDCDDGDAAFNPDAVEDDCADPADYNCDGSVGYADADGDGFAACEECDDADAAVHPGQHEICDGVDNDCDGTTDGSAAVGASVWYADADTDGYGDPAVTVTDCDAPSGYVADASDCDDAASASYPGADEVCDGADNDCDGDTDESATDASIWYFDSDGDGEGGAALSETACAASAGFVASSTDCDDLDASAYTGGSEVCDGADNDCDGTVDNGASDATTYYLDADSDGYGDSGSSVSSCELPSGYVLDDADCDDTAGGVYPGAVEICDSTDWDCDGMTDDSEGDDALTWYLDADADGYGDADSALLACAQPSGYVSVDGDCDDSDGSIHPITTETPGDGVDSDCDGDDGCGDLNCDGWPDLVFTGYHDDTSWTTDSYIYYGSATGYSASDRLALPTNGAWDVKVQDIDDDGYVDLLFPSAREDSSYASDSRVYWGSAAGYSASDATDLSSSGSVDACVGDLDQDGYNDIVLPGYYDGNYSVTSSIYWGSSGGYSGANVTDFVNYGVRDCEIEDLNQDGYPDLVFATYYDGNDATNSTIYWGSSTGIDTADITSLPAYRTPRITLADVDEDGWTDILMPNYYDGNYATYSRIYYGSSAGYSTSDVDTMLTYGAWHATVADFDQDGRNDVLWAAYRPSSTSYYVSSYLYYGSAVGFNTGSRDALPAYGVLDAHVEDFDNDGWDDVFLNSYYDGNSATLAYVYTNDSGSGMDTSSPTTLAVYGSGRTDVSDLDGDGFLDLVVPSYSDGSSEEIDSYIFWGNVSGFSDTDRTDLPTNGATSVVVVGSL